MLARADRRADHLRVVRVRDQRDDEVILLEFPVEGGVVIDVKSNGLGVLEALRELLCIFEGAAGWRVPQLAIGTGQKDM